MLLFSLEEQFEQVRCGRAFLAGPRTAHSSVLSEPGMSLTAVGLFL